MITDPDQIQAAISQIISDDSYVRLQAKDFADICPNPEWAIHVRDKSVDALLGQLDNELPRTGDNRLRGIVVYIQSASLSLADLSRIDGIIPSAQRFKRGLGFNDDDPETEIWIFAEALQ